MLLMAQVRSVLHMFYNERKQNVIIQLTHFGLHVFLKIFTASPAFSDASDTELRFISTAAVNVLSTPSPTAFFLLLETLKRLGKALSFTFISSGWLCF